MAKIRVHELAKELGKSSKEMVETLMGLGLDVKNHMSTIEESQAGWVRKRLTSKGEDKKQEVERIGTGKTGGDFPGQQPPVTPPKRQLDSGKQNVITNRTPVGKEVTKMPERDNRYNNAARPREESAQNNRSMRPQQGQSPANARNNMGGPRESRPAQDNRNIRPQQGQSPANARNNMGGLRESRPTQDNRNMRPQQGQSPYNNNRNNMGGPRESRPAQDNRNIRPQQGQAPSNNRSNVGGTAGRPNFSGPQATDARRTERPNNQKPGSGANARPAANTDNRPQGPGQRPLPAGGGAAPGKKPVKKTVPQHVARDYSRPHKKSKHKRKKENVELQTPELISVESTIMVRDLAEKLNKNAAELMKKLMEMGTMATINQMIDYDTAEIVASLYDVKVELALSEEAKILEEIVDDESTLQPRPPVVTVMGHVDHGKTSLLDRIRKADVASGEAGGITQHIGAYQVKINDSKITFIDTPGHEAFTAMRARGANLTDIVILVVAADDGVMPQTVEAINHIKAAKVPFLVAINKMDKPEADAERLKQQLTEYEIVAEEWGGDTIFVPVSAKTGIGIDNLLEMVLLVAEMKEIKANPNRQAFGVVIEGELDKGRGAVATVLVLNGTLKIGDYVICGTNWCKVRAMSDYRGNRVDSALPSVPVEITGWSGVPEAGGKVQVCDEKVAKEIISLRLSEKKIEEQRQSSRVSLDDFFQQMKDSEVKELNLIIKGDVQGSVEALRQSLIRLATSEVKVNVIHSAVGAITETDVMLASASNAIIIGFNIRPDTKARKYAEDENIDVRLYRVIYEAIDDVKKAMTGLLDPEFKEKYLGRAEVRALFKVPNIGIIAGSYVTDGKILRNANVRVLRDGVIVYEGSLSSLKRFKDDAKEVVENYECGIGIKDFNDLKEGDVFEAFTMEEVPREL